MKVEVDVEACIDSSYIAGQGDTGSILKFTKIIGLSKIVERKNK